MSKVLKKEETEQKQIKRNWSQKEKLFYKGKFQDVFNNFINTFFILETGRKKIFFKGMFKTLYLTKLLKYFIFLFCRRWVANGTDVLVVQPGYQIILIANRYQNLSNFINEVMDLHFLRIIILENF